MKKSNISKIDLSLQSGIEELCTSKKAPKYLSSLQDANILTIENLLWLSPKSIQKLPKTAPFTSSKPSEKFKGAGEIVWVKRIPLKNARQKFLCNVQVKVIDLFSNTSMVLYWFNSYPSTYNKLKSLNKITFSGTMSKTDSLGMANPNVKPWDGKQEEHIEEISVEYPVLNKVQGHHIQKLFLKIPNDFYRNIKEELPLEISKKNNLISFSEAIKLFHCHPSVKDKWSEDKYEIAKTRLIYEELFWEQLKLSGQKFQRNQFKSPIIKWSNSEEARFTEILPFQLTKGQQKVITEVRHDIKLGIPMHRILQGDVGCGKTIVAILIANLIAKEGYQVAILCPTEGLANQFFENVKKYNAFNLEIDLIVGGSLTKAKKLKLENLAKGKTKIVVGTHALIQSKIEFSKLGLSIIDEQHKFGVKQRNLLIKKSVTKHFLLMSATPIPRSLGLTVFGNLEISTITETPNKDKKISTKIITHDLRAKMLSFILTRVSMGEQAYIVVPAIEESEQSNLINLKEIFLAYRRFFPKISMAPLHGKMKAEEKNETLKRFKKNEISILVSTTVIEVGIDVPNSTVMVIYNPERFGLSSLHQLRGRVGRGEKPGFCFLDCLKDMGKDSKKRLEKFIKCKDGFDIAETDLEIRGPGDFIGNEQSGHVVKRKVSDPLRDYRMLVQVKNDITHLSDKFPSEYNKCLEKIKKENLVSPI